MANVFENKFSTKRSILHDSVEALQSIAKAQLGDPRGLDPCPFKQMNKSAPFCSALYRFPPNPFFILCHDKN